MSSEWENLFSFSPSSGWRWGRPFRLRRLAQTVLPRRSLGNALSELRAHPAGPRPDGDLRLDLDGLRGRHGLHDPCSLRNEAPERAARRHEPLAPEPGNHHPRYFPGPCISSGRAYPEYAWLMAIGLIIFRTSLTAAGLTQAAAKVCEIPFPPATPPTGWPGPGAAS